MIKEYLSYLRDNPEGYWFKRKLYGLGWTPVTWQGWFVVLVYTVSLVKLALSLEKNAPVSNVLFTFILPVLLLTTVLIAICYKTGERLQWQWGLMKDKKDN